MLDVEFESATGLTFQQLLLFLAYCPGRSHFWGRRRRTKIQWRKNP